MTTKLEEIARKAQQKPKQRFTSIAHHITKELIWESLKKINPKTAPGVDGIRPKEAMETFPLDRNNGPENASQRV